MRAAIALLGLALVATAGIASAGDAMMPILLEEQAAAVPPAADAPAQEPQSLPFRFTSPAAFWVALVAAALVTVGSLWWVGRDPPSAA